jgi:hypothetical protein
MLPGRTAGCYRRLLGTDEPAPRRRRTMAIGTGTKLAELTHDAKNNLMRAI